MTVFRKGILLERWVTIQTPCGLFVRYVTRTSPTLLNSFLTLKLHTSLLMLTIGLASKDKFLRIILPLLNIFGRAGSTRMAHPRNVSVITAATTLQVRVTTGLTIILGFSKYRMRSKQLVQTSFACSPILQSIQFLRLTCQLFIAVYELYSTLKMRKYLELK